MEDRGEVISIKFSYDMKVLAIQRSHKSVVRGVVDIDSRNLNYNKSHNKTYNFLRILLRQIAFGLFPGICKFC